MMLCLLQTFVPSDGQPSERFKRLLLRLATTPSAMTSQRNDAAEDVHQVRFDLRVRR